MYFYTAAAGPDRKRVFAMMTIPVPTTVGAVKAHLRDKAAAYRISKYFAGEFDLLEGWYDSGRLLDTGEVLPLPPEEPFVFHFFVRPRRELGRAVPPRTSHALARTRARVRMHVTPPPVHHLDPPVPLHSTDAAVA